jgi:hypothetical protein
LLGAAHQHSAHSVKHLQLIQVIADEATNLPGRLDPR